MLTLRKWYGLGLGLGLAVLVSAFALSASTAMAATAAPNNIPATAQYIDGQMHPIDANGSLWYRFDYDSKGTPVTVRLVNGNNSGVGFDVYNSASLSDWWDDTPIGRGTTEQVSCNNGAPEINGKCQATDLDWVGKFPELDSYYVRVVNNNATPANFTLTVQGDGVGLGQ